MTRIHGTGQQEDEYGCGLEDAECVCPIERAQWNGGRHRFKVGIAVNQRDLMF